MQPWSVHFPVFLLTHKQIFRMTYLLAGPDYYCLCQSLQQLNSSVSDPHWPSVLCCLHSHLVQTLPQSLQEAPLQLSVYVSTLPHSMVFVRSILRITNLIQSVFKMYEKWQTTVCHMKQGFNKAIKINLKYWQFVILIRCRPLKYIHGMSVKRNYIESHLDISVQTLFSTINIQMTTV